MADAVGFHEIAGPGTPARRPDTLWWLAAVTLAVVLAVPFFLVDVPPVLDYPNHLARYLILAHPDDPVLSSMYAPHWRILPNLAMDLAGAGLLRLFDPHVAGRLLLAFSLFAPLVGVVTYSRVMFGRFSYWPLASGAIAYNAVFFLGFMNFQLSLGLALAGAAVFTVLRKRGHSAMAAGVGAATACIVFFAHLMGLTFFVLLVAAHEWARLWRRRGEGTFARDAAKVLGWLVLMLMPVLILFMLCPQSDVPSSVGSWHAERKLWAVFGPVMTTSINLTLVSALVLFCFAVTAWRHVVFAPGIALALTVLGAAFVVVPSAIGNGTFIDIRIPQMIALLLFAGVQPRLSRSHSIAAGLAFAALIALRAGYVATTWHDSRQDVADLRAAIALVKPGAKVLVARGHPGNWTEAEMPTRALPGINRLDGHLPALLLIERRAFWPLLFADPAQQPVAVRPPYDRLTQPLGEPLDWAVLQQEGRSAPHYFDDWREDFDNVLLIDAPASPPSLTGLTLLRSGSFAVLYRIERGS